MMKIDRSNYEIWLIDWLDGNLNDLQVEQVQAFLAENPDLKEEFGEIEFFSLKPSKNGYPDKSSLRRSAGELSQTQFEYLCAASVENDLTDDQQTELDELIGEDPEKRKVFELFGKTKLSPVNVIYPFKKQLIRRTALQNVIRISFIGFSAAAVIAVAFVLYFSRTPDLPLKHESVSQVIVRDSIVKVNPVRKTGAEEPRKESDKKNIPVKRQNIKNTVPAQHYARSASLSPQDHIGDVDSASNRTQIVVRKINLEPDVDFTPVITANLISLNFSPAGLQEDDERPRFSRFIARTFREKFLKDRSPKDSPLKVYEIAKASVTGLNKLLGWEMALDERKDLNGQLKSVYFSSKILKFNAPVKNSESPK